MNCYNPIDFNYDKKTKLTNLFHEISGVKYKLRGAYKEGADVFIAPSENYEEALKVAEENDMDIEIIEAKTFNQVVEDLKNRKN